MLTQPVSDKMIITFLLWKGKASVCYCIDPAPESSLLFVFLFDQSLKYCPFFSLLHELRHFNVGITHTIVDKNITTHNEGQSGISLPRSEQLHEYAEIICLRTVPSNQEEEAKVEYYTSKDQNY